MDRRELIKNLGLLSGTPFLTSGDLLTNEKQIMDIQIWTSYCLF